MVKIGTVNFFAAPHCHAVSAFAALATVVPRHEEVIITPMLYDKRSLDGIGARIFRGGVGWRVLESRVVATRYGPGPFALCDMHRGVEACQLYAIPERAPDEPRHIVVVDDEVGVDGVPVVAILPRGDDTPLIVPDGEGERATAQQSYGRAVLAEGGAAVGHPPTVVPPDDVGSPHMV